MAAVRQVNGLAWKKAVIGTQRSCFGILDQKEGKGKDQDQQLKEMT
jgi:hypothetical protein